MIRHFIVKKRAQRDVAGMAKYLSHDSLAIAHRFLDAFDETFRSLAEIPLGGFIESGNPAYRKLRVWPINGFPNHLIYYREIAARIEVVRVLHGARDLTKFFG